MADVMTDLLKAHLRQLHCRRWGRVREAGAGRRRQRPNLRRVLAPPDRAGTGGPRRQRGRARIKQAGFPVVKDFDTFDFTALPGLSKPKVLELATRRMDRTEIQLLSDREPRDWEDPHRHCAGPGGLPCGQAGAFFTAAELVSQLEKAQKQYTLDRLLRQLERPHLLICDELGYVSLEPRRRRAAVPRLRRPLRAREPPGHEQPAVQRMESGLPGGTDDRGVAGSPDPPLPHLRDEWRELPLPRVDEGEEGSKVRMKQSCRLCPERLS